MKPRLWQDGTGTLSGDLPAGDPSARSKSGDSVLPTTAISDLIMSDMPFMLKAWACTDIADARGAASLSKQCAGGAD